MRDDRFGSYSMAATVAGMLCLSRLKSIRRYICLCPPPRCRHVMRQRPLRPPVFLSGTSRDFSGVRLVTSSKVATLWNRRPGEVGRYFRTGISAYPLVGFCLVIYHPGPRPDLSRLQRERSGSQRTVRHGRVRWVPSPWLWHPLRPSLGAWHSAYTPSYSSIVSPSFRVAIAFFQSGRRPWKRPRRFVFPRTRRVRTSRTVTLKSSSMACLISILLAVLATWKR